MLNFAQSAVCSPEVSKALTSLGERFATALQAKLSTIEAPAKTKSIVFFPVLIDPAVGSLPDKTTLRRTEPTVFVRSNIPYKEWAEATPTERVRLYTNALCEGLARVGKSRLSGAETERLMRLATEVATDFELSIDN